MPQAKSLLGAGLFALGVGTGLLLSSTLYSYGQEGAGPYRVNRLTGVQQFATEWGWATTGEIDERVARNDRHIEAEIAPEVARFGSRVAEMRLAAREGRLRKVEVVGRGVSAYFSDGHREQYYALDADDPRLQDADAIAHGLSFADATAGSTAGSTTE